MPKGALLLRRGFWLFLLLSLVSCGGGDSSLSSDAGQQFDDPHSKLFFGHDFPDFSVGDTSGVAQGSGSGGVSVIDEAPTQPFRCVGGYFVDGLLVDTPSQDIVIDGGGRDTCIRVQSECKTLVRARSITLTNCRYCADVLWGGALELHALDGEIFCDSLLDSVRVRGGSSALLSASEGVSLISLRRDSAIRVGWDSSVSVESGGSCRIEGDPPLRITGNGIVEASSCMSPVEEDASDSEDEEELDSSEESGESGEGDAVEPQTTPIPDDPPDAQPGPSVPEFAATDEAIRCRRGVLAFDEPGRDLVIDGGGRSRCIRIERGCTASVRARSITLTNCRECIEATRGSTLDLTATEGGISCDATRDALRVDGGSIVRLHSNADISLIAVGSNRRNDGIQSTRGSRVDLRAPGLCRIEAAGTALNLSEGDVVDTSGCGQVSLSQ